MDKDFSLQYLNNADSFFKPASVDNNIKKLQLKGSSIMSCAGVSRYDTIKFSTQGSYWACANSYNMYIYSAKTNSLVRAYSSEGYGKYEFDCSTIEFIDDEHFINCRLEVVNIFSGQIVKKFGVRSKRAYYMHFSPELNYLFVGWGYNGKETPLPSLFDLENGKETQIDVYFSQLCFAIENKLIYFKGSHPDHRIHKYDISKSKMFELPHNETYISDIFYDTVLGLVAISSEGNILYNNDKNSFKQLKLKSKEQLSYCANDSKNNLIYLKKERTQLVVFNTKNKKQYEIDLGFFFRVMPIPGKKQFCVMSKEDTYIYEAISAKLVATRKGITQAVAPNTASLVTKIANKKYDFSLNIGNKELHSHIEPDDLHIHSDNKDYLFIYDAKKYIHLYLPSLELGNVMDLLDFEHENRPTKRIISTYKNKKTTIGMFNKFDGSFTKYFEIDGKTNGFLSVSPEKFMVFFLDSHHTLIQCFEKTKLEWELFFEHNKYKTFDISDDKKYLIMKQNMGEPDFYDTSDGTMTEKPSEELFKTYETKFKVGAGFDSIAVSDRLTGKTLFSDQYKYSTEHLIFSNYLIYVSEKELVKVLDLISWQTFETGLTIPFRNKIYSTKGYEYAYYDNEEEIAFFNPDDLSHFSIKLRHKGKSPTLFKNNEGLWTLAVIGANHAIHFYDVESKEFLAQLAINHKGDFLFKTTADEQAKFGWFYTNNEEFINTIVQNYDARELQLADDEQQNKNLRIYHSYDMVYKKLHQHKAFDESKALFEHEKAQNLNANALDNKQKITGALGSGSKNNK